MITDRGKIEAIRTPKPLNQLSQNLAWVIKSAISPSMWQNSKSVVPLGASRQMGEILLLLGL